MTPGGTALITGASSGLGAALAPALAREGYDLVLVARRRERLEALAASVRTETGRRVEVVELDVCAEDALARLQAVCPAPRLLVNNAGIGRFGPAESISVEEQARVVRLNCEVVTRLTLGYMPALLAQGEGVVLNMASIAGFQPLPFYAVYGASKAYVLDVSEALDAEYAPRGVRVVAVSPGPVPTEFQAHSGSPDARHGSWWTRVTPEDVAAVCVDVVRRPRRHVTPARLHGWLRWVQRFVPRSWVVGAAASKMRKRIG